MSGRQAKRQRRQVAASRKELVRGRDLTAGLSSSEVGGILRQWNRKLRGL